MMRQFLVTALGIACVLLSTVVGANVALDPFGFFGFTLPATERKISFDERGQKVNHLLYAAQPQYDGILLGSSRTTYIPADAFTTGRFFNLAAPNMYPREYAGYVAIARRTQPITKVVVGADFFVTNKNPIFGFPGPAHYLKQASLKTLASFDGLGYSAKTLRCSLTQDCSDDYYDARFIKHMLPRTPQKKLSNVVSQLELFDARFYGAEYEWNTQVGAELAALRRDNPQAKFIFFTPPIAAPLFDLLVAKGRLPAYERWLRLIVAEFGGVYDFGGYNSITANLDHYVDAHHFTPQVGRMIAARIEGRPAEAPADFGVWVTAANIEEHIASLRRQSAIADRDPLATYRRLLAAAK